MSTIWEYSRTLHCQQNQPLLPNTRYNKLKELKPVYNYLYVKMITDLKWGDGMNPNDRIRRQIFGYFYERNNQATSKIGKRGSSVKISDAKRELKISMASSNRK
jgi:hypothetical protein